MTRCASIKASSLLCPLVICILPPPTGQPQIWQPLAPKSPIPSPISPTQNGHQMGQTHCSGDATHAQEAPRATYTQTKALARHARWHASPLHSTRKAILTPAIKAPPAYCAQGWTIALEQSQDSPSQPLCPSCSGMWSVALQSGGERG